MYECLQSRQGSGVLVWMTQPAWPSLICQLYDYYFEPTAAFYGAKTACEPLHILWDQNSDRIKVANDTLDDRPGLDVEAATYDLRGVETWHASSRIVAHCQATRDCFALPRPADPAVVFFVKLRLIDRGVLVSQNFYWSAGKGRPCTALNDLPGASLAGSATRVVAAGETILTATLRNGPGAVALMVRLKVERARTGGRVLPSNFDDNFFSLLPGESRVVTIRIPNASLAGEQPRLLREGWNLPETEIPIADRPPPA
jgi:hypothetical protein